MTDHENPLGDALGADDEAPLDADANDDLIDSADADQQAAEEGTKGDVGEVPGDITGAV